MSAARAWWDALNPVWKRIFQRAARVPAEPSDDHIAAKIWTLDGIRCGQKKIETLGPLARLTGLKELNVDQGEGHKPTSPPDLEALRGLRRLEVLNIDACDAVVDLSPLAGLTRLRELDVGNTGAVSLAPLARLTALESLFAAGLGVRDLSPLKRLRKLRSLSVAVCPVAKVDALAGLDALESLDLGQTKIVDLAPLAGLSRLTELEAHRSQVRSLEPIWKLPLKTLGIYKTRVKASEISRYRLEHPQTRVVA